MTDPAERTVRAFFDRVWNAGDDLAAEGLFAPGFRHHDLVTHGEADLAGFLHSIQWIRGLFVTLDFQVLDAVVQDGRVATRWRAEGRHGATGKRVGIDGMSFDHVRDGRIVEDWTVWDRVGLREQLPEEFAS
ncbi:MAG TPA: ester cyclase [Candidatus Binatia bacterium]|nr:ester cyclase [Candidatus Binatia bacterium]